MTRIIASAGRLVDMAFDLGDWGLGVGIAKTGFGDGGVKTRLWHIARPVKSFILHPVHAPVDFCTRTHPGEI